jgi:hypothetical protein
VPDLPERILAHPSVRRLKRIAARLGPMAGEVVFIGGAIAPLLQTATPFDEVRPTKDVDGVFASGSYGQGVAIGERLRALGFSQMAESGDHAHRWRTPDGDLFDLVPAGDHLGASGQEWDRAAFRDPVRVDLGDGIVARHANAPAFVALKLAAYHDRGKRDPHASHDLEDVLALLVSRPTIEDEMAAADPAVRRSVEEEIADLLARSDIEDLLAGHLNNAQDPAAVIRLARKRLEVLVAGAR